MMDLERLAGRLRWQQSELQAELADVESALRRVEQGSYGVCGRCGELIDAERLSTYPATNWCRACKREYELRRGFTPSP